MKTLANGITASRIILSFGLLCCNISSPAFYLLYILAGLSDIADGFIARKTNTESEYGAKLDSIADFIFFAISFIKFLPLLNFSVWIWIWIGGIAAIKLYTATRYGHLPAVHSFWNKFTGFLLFLFPFMQTFKAVPVIICIAASIASIQEISAVKKGRSL